MTQEPSIILIEQLATAQALLRPLRIAVLKELAQTRSCPEIGAALGLSAQKVYYHVKELEKAGLVKQVGERRARGVMEALYQAAGQSYYLAPDLVGLLGGKARAQERLSLDFLGQLAQSMLEDAQRLSRADGPVPSLGLEAQIELADSHQREAFMQELTATVQALAEKYGARRGRRGSGALHTYKLRMACYPLSEMFSDD